MITGVNHIGLAVRSIDETLAKWKVQLGAEEIGRCAYPTLGQTSVLVKVGDSYFELMEPLGTEGVIPSFLEKHGEGFHHISLHSDDLQGDCKRLEETGVRILGRPGDPVMFTHPKTTTGVVYEITESRNEKVDVD
jgi:methylmalonyl-CoA epimerase